MKSTTYFSPKQLQDGQKVVYRDRENPNNIGSVKIIEGIPFINGLEFDDICPLRKDVRIVEEGFSPRDYFQNSQDGFDRYLNENPQLKTKNITKAMNIFFE